jgi:hypothetical protein
MITALLAVCEKFKLHPVVVFALALHYNERHWSNKRVHEYFVSWLEQDEEMEDTMRLTEIPKFIEDYCIDLMAGITVLPKWFTEKTKQLEAQNELDSAS